MNFILTIFLFVPFLSDQKVSMRIKNNHNIARGGKFWDCRTSAWFPDQTFVRLSGWVVKWPESYHKGRTFESLHLGMTHQQILVYEPLVGFQC